MPGQEGSRRDEPTAMQRDWQQPGQCRQDRPAGPVRRRPGDLMQEHHDPVTQHHDLGILGRLAAAQQDQPAKDPGRDQIQQTDTHEPRSCPNPLIRPNRSSQTMHRVLKRYRPKQPATS